MNNTNKFEKFSYQNVVIDKAFAERRIMLTFNSIWWESFSQYLRAKGLKVENLKIAEVGCGSGAKSLLLALLGAEATLIDIDEDALQVAKKMFDLYNCKASFIKANALEDPDKSLINKFDYVSSGGLVEHFRGKDRVKVMAFHRELLNEKGFAMISSPNLLSPLYWFNRIFRTICGVWNIGTEIPFTNWELKCAGEKAGFKDTSVLRTATFKQDLVAYGYACIAMMAKFFPKKIIYSVKKGSTYSKFKKFEVNAELGSQDIRENLVNRFKSFTRHVSKSLNDYFGSNIIFFGSR